MPTVRRLSSADSRPSRTRSAVTNGRRAFVDGDGNSAWYRRRKDIVELHLDDMGGRDALSEAQISLACRAASIEVELEQMEEPQRARCRRETSRLRPQTTPSRTAPPGRRARPPNWPHP